MRHGLNRFAIAGGVIFLLLVGCFFDPRLARAQTQIEGRTINFDSDQLTRLNVRYTKSAEVAIEQCRRDEFSEAIRKIHNLVGLIDDTILQNQEVINDWSSHGLQVEDIHTYNFVKEQQEKLVADAARLNALILNLEQQYRVHCKVILEKESVKSQRQAKSKTTKRSKAKSKDDRPAASSGMSPETARTIGTIIDIGIGVGLSRSHGHSRGRDSRDDTPRHVTPKSDR